MEFTQKQWMYGGAVLLTMVSGSIVFGRVPTIWLPMPMPIMLAVFLTLILFPFVTPVLYILEMKLVSRSIHFMRFVVGLVLILGYLNYLYFQTAWEYGIVYQGLEHTRIVAIVNFAGFGVAFALSVIALAKKSLLLARTANLFLFVLLSWCAFPYLGELP